MSATQKIISVKNLKKNYGTFEAVKNISFDVYEGEIFGLLGPNGAGKSTTLEIIETLREKTSGEVLVNGLNLDTKADDIKKIIGVQLQTSGFYPGLNLLELIELFGGLYNKTVDGRELLKLVNLEEKAKNKFKELSGGQKQRFSIATTLINQPKIVFLDEPTTGLDPQARRNLWELIKDIRAKGTTVIITTHYMDEAERCNRLAYIVYGNLMAEGTIPEIIKQSGLVAWRANGKNLPELADSVRDAKGVAQVVIWGNELRICGTDESLLRRVVSEHENYQWHKTETSLEEVFIHLVSENPEGATA